MNGSMESQQAFKYQDMKVVSQKGMKGNGITRIDGAKSGLVYHSKNIDIMF
jgi:hypothetical protein